MGILYKYVYGIHVYVWSSADYHKKSDINFLTNSSKKYIIKGR